jgi:hypothetical protein
VTPFRGHFSLALAHLALCAAAIRALPSGLIVRLPVGASPLSKGAVPISRDRTCCNVRISESIVATMPVVSMGPFYSGIPGPAGKIVPVNLP